MREEYMVEIMDTAGQVKIKDQRDCEACSRAMR